MAVNDGTDVMISLLASAVVNATTSQSMDLATDMIETTTKDSSKVKTYKAGERGGTQAIEGKLDVAATYDWEDLFNAWKAGTALSCVYGLGVKDSGEDIYSCSVLISGLSRSDPKNAESTWSCSLQITGDVTLTTSTATIAG